MNQPTELHRGVWFGVRERQPRLWGAGGLLSMQQHVAGWDMNQAMY